MEKVCGLVEMEWGLGVMVYALDGLQYLTVQEEWLPEVILYSLVKR